MLDLEGLDAAAGPGRHDLGQRVPNGSLGEAASPALRRVGIAVDVIDVDLVQVGRAVRRVGVHAGRSSGALALGRVAPVPQPDGVAELVAGDVVATAVVAQVRRVARVEVEDELLVAAPSVAARIEALRRIGRTVDPTGCTVLTVIPRIGDDVGQRCQVRLLAHDEHRRVVILGHGVAQRGRELRRQRRVEMHVVAQVVAHARAARRAHVRTLADRHGADVPAAVVRRAHRRREQQHDGREERREPHAAHRALGEERRQTTPAGLSSGGCPPRSGRGGSPLDSGPRRDAAPASRGSRGRAPAAPRSCDRRDARSPADVGRTTRPRNARVPVPHAAPARSVRAPPCSSSSRRPWQQPSVVASHACAVRWGGSYARSKRPCNGFQDRWTSIPSTSVSVAFTAGRRSSAASSVARSASSTATSARAPGRR